MLTKLQFYIGLGIISILSLLPGSAMPRLGSQDKVCHAIGYLMLFLSVSIGYNFRKWNLVKFSGLFLYSILIEVAQFYIPNRTLSGFDMMANAIGLMIGWGIVVVYSKRVDRRLN